VVATGSEFGCSNRPCMLKTLMLLLHSLPRDRSHQGRHAGLLPIAPSQDFCGSVQYSRMYLSAYTPVGCVIGASRQRQVKPAQYSDNQSPILSLSHFRAATLTLKRHLSPIIRTTRPRLHYYSTAFHKQRTWITSSSRLHSVGEPTRAIGQ
jgi:hypothetical protein